MGSQARASLGSSHLGDPPTAFFKANKRPFSGPPTVARRSLPRFSASLPMSVTHAPMMIHDDKNPDVNPIKRANKLALFNSNKIRVYGMLAVT